ncbi:MAG: hypothetical protein MI919_27635 [Holophagales bacterium]|nr:hypothetical protein [Holophagales bacterium]
MAIRFLARAEPLTLASRQPGQEPILAKSDVYRQLRSELTRYVKGEVQGRSYLIAGHRGAGKTTLVRHVVHDVSEDLGREGFRPLLVRLQGPELLAVREPERREVAGDGWAYLLPEPRSEAAGESAGEAAEAPAAEVSSYRVATTALQKVTLAIYRALAGELAHRYQRKLRRTSERRGRSEPGLSPEAAEELAGQMRLALDSAPQPEELRELWRRAGCLGSGVLFHSTTVPQGQGIRELVALASAAQAYRKVLGREERRATESGGASSESSISARASLSGSGLSKVLMPLAAGGAGVAGIALGNAGAGLGVAALTVLAGLAGEIGSRRARTRNREEEYVFIADASVTTLERELPALVERLQAARLAPVFVVDELDKVDHLETSMSAVVDHLKHFVAEGAFFCFLTDRDYFETLHRRLETETYPKEYTYFQDRVLVSYRPSDLRDYLRRVLEADNDTDRADREILISRLLHRACLHQVDLRRELRRLPKKSDGATLDLDPGFVRSVKGTQLEVLAQAAVETVLAAPELRERLESDPAFWQPVVDALYCASRSWRGGELRLALDGESFRTYLEDRMRPNGSQPSQRRPASPRSAPKPGFPIQEVDFEELHGLARSVAGYLAEPSTLLADLPSLVPDHSPEVMSVLLEVQRRLTADDPGGFRLLEPLGDGRYRWCSDVFGRLRPAPGPDMFSDRATEPGAPIAEPAPAAEPSAEPETGPDAGIPELRAASREPEAAAGKSQASGSSGPSESDEPASVGLPGSTLSSKRRDGPGFRRRGADLPRSMGPEPEPADRSDDRVTAEWAALLPEAVIAEISFDEAFWELRDRFREVEKIVFEQTERLDLEALGSEVGLLPSSPSWLQVSASLRNLEARVKAGEETFDRHDVEMLAAFRELLREREQPMAWAFRHASLGDRIGDPEGGGSKAGLDRALAQLSELLGLRGLGSSISLLRRRMEEFDATMPESLRPSLAGLPGLWDAPSEWLAYWKKSADVPDPVPDLHAVDTEVWQKWSPRLKRFLLGQDWRAPAEWPDYVCAVARLGPSLLTERPLDRMTLGDWSRLVNRISGLTSGMAAPIWVQAPFWAALGFRADAHPLGNMVLLDGDAMATDWTEWLERTRVADRPRRAVMVTVDPSSSHSGWPVSKNAGGWIVPATELSGSPAFHGSIRDFLEADTDEERLLLLECPHAASVAGLERIAGLLSADPRNTVMLVPEDLSLRRAPFPLVVAPRDLDDAFGRALEVRGG